MDSLQFDLFEKSIADRFADWKATQHGGQLLCRLYRITAEYYGRFKATQGRRRVSQRLLWELLRDRLDGIRGELKRRGIVIDQEKGFVLNDHFTAHAVRHMIAEHPEWAAMFELRQLRDGERRGRVKRQRVIVIQDLQVTGRN